MNGKKLSLRGFSLVELVIVVVIIGVIAAIAVPRISRGAKGAGDAALRMTLTGIRNAIDMYAAEHGGSFPTGVDQAALETQLTGKTDYDGTPNATGDYGPYLRSGFPTLPVCALKGQSDVKFPLTAAGDPVADGTTAWAYSTDTGRFIANCAVAEVDENGDKYNEY
ncbi:MAG: prepilin-type N-terminal cleavage/methylation domain-containing protein [Phycisphaerales bacterium]|nr:MAG: prepilin-type N-terminal cleavage/methylation domain-containing protein [Phycisphaerales bacterium]